MKRYINKTTKRAAVFLFSLVLVSSSFAQVNFAKAEGVGASSSDPGELTGVTTDSNHEDPVQEVSDITFYGLSDLTVYAIDILYDLDEEAADFSDRLAARLSDIYWDGVAAQDETGAAATVRLVSDGGFDPYAAVDTTYIMVYEAVHADGTVYEGTRSVTLKVENVIYSVFQTIMSAAATTVITSEQELKEIADLSGSYTLGNDIELTEPWTPIGSIVHPFTGTFDGNGYSITGLTATGMRAGLFGYTEDALVSNLGIDVVSLTDNVEHGAVAGHALNTVFSNIGVTGNGGGIIEVTGGGYAGGIVGKMDGGSIKDATVTGLQISTGGNYCGGIVGFANHGAIIENCHVNDTAVTGRSYVGGMAGGSGAAGSASYAAQFLNCTTSAAVSSDGPYVGGFSGVSYGGTVIKDCEATGDVSCTYSGGSYAGGFVSAAYEGSKITGCYAAGKVTGGGNYVGGFIGELYGASGIEMCIAMGSVTAEGDIVGGFAGETSGGSTLDRVGAGGDVSGGQGYVGGLIGTMHDTTLNQGCAYGNVTIRDGYIAGGLVGEAAYDAIMTDVYARGNVTAAGGSGKGLGGLVGYFSGVGDQKVKHAYTSGTVYGPPGSQIGAFSGYTTVEFNGSNYYDATMAGTLASCGTAGTVTGTGLPVGKSTEDMVRIDTFEEGPDPWNFSGIWSIDTAPASYPYFWWMGPGQAPATEAPAISTPPAVEPVSPGADAITGKGVAEADIVVTFPGGKTAETVVNSDGSWSVDIPADGYTPATGDEITAIQTESGKSVSMPTTVVVGPDLEHPDTDSKLSKKSVGGYVPGGTAEYEIRFLIASNAEHFGGLLIRDILRSNMTYDSYSMTIDGTSVNVEPMVSGEVVFLLDQPTIKKYAGKEVVLNLVVDVAPGTTGNRVNKVELRYMRGSSIPDEPDADASAAIVPVTSLVNSFTKTADTDLSTGAIKAGGDEIIFTVTAGIADSIDAAYGGLLIYDDLPAVLDWDPDAPGSSVMVGNTLLDFDLTYGKPAVYLNSIDLETMEGQTVVMTIAATVNDKWKSGGITNAAKVYYQSGGIAPDPDGADNSSPNDDPAPDKEVKTTVPVDPDIPEDSGMEKKRTAVDAVAGTATYEITFDLAANATSFDGVVIKDVLPAGSTYEDYSLTINGTTKLPVVDTHVQGVVTVKIARADLVSDGAVKLTLTVNTGSAASLRNKAYLRYIRPGETGSHDPETGHDDEAETPVAPIIPSGSKMKKHRTVIDTVAGTAAYEINFNLAANATGFSGAVIKDVLPAGTTYKDCVLTVNGIAGTPVVNSGVQGEVTIKIAKADLVSGAAVKLVLTVNSGSATDLKNKVYLRYIRPGETGSQNPETDSDDRAETPSDPFDSGGGSGSTPTPTITPTITPGATPSTTPSVTPSTTPGVTPSTTPNVAPSTTPTITPSATPAITPSATPTITPSATPTITPSATPTITPSAAPTNTPTATPTATPVSTPTTTATPKITSTPKATSTPKVTSKPKSREINTYTVTFHWNYGSDRTEKRDIKTPAKSVGTGNIPIASRTGYSFAGWNTQSNGRGLRFYGFTVITGDLDVWAQWTLKNAASGGNGSTDAGNTTGGTGNASGSGRNGNTNAGSSIGGTGSTGGGSTGGTGGTNGISGAGSTGGSGIGGSGSMAGSSTGGFGGANGIGGTGESGGTSGSSYENTNFDSVTDDGNTQDSSSGVTGNITGNSLFAQDDEEDTWALINLILCIFGTLLTICTVIRILLEAKHNQRHDQKEDFDTDDHAKWYKHYHFTLLTVTIIMGVAGMILFLLTQDFIKGRMILIDVWTIINEDLFAIGIVTVVFDILEQSYPPFRSE